MKKTIIVEKRGRKMTLTCSGRDTWTFEGDWSYCDNAPDHFYISDKCEHLRYYYVRFPEIGNLKLMVGYTDCTGCHVKSWHPVQGADVVESLVAQLLMRSDARGRVKVTVKRGEDEPSTFWC